MYFIRLQITHHLRAGIIKTSSHPVSEVTLLPRFLERVYNGRDAENWMLLHSEMLIY